MNIQAITSGNLSSRNNINPKSSQNCLSANTSYQNLRPLAQDTVSFGEKYKFVKKLFQKRSPKPAPDTSKAKQLEKWDPNGLSQKEINKIVQSFKEPLDKFNRDLREALKPLICTDAKPDNIILPGSRGIHGRIKDIFGAATKANSRKKFTAEEVKKMGDIGGTRIVMRTTSREDFAKIFELLGIMVKKGYKVTDVENYRLTPKDSYISRKTLDEFEELCQKHDQYPRISSEPKKSGYSAVQVNFELPGGKRIEVQIMGVDVETTKGIQDLLYKRIECKKDLPEAYKDIQAIIDEEVEKMTEYQQEAYQTYQRDAFAYAKNLPARSSRSKFNPERNFLPYPYFLPERLSYINLYRMKEADDLAAKEATKLKELTELEVQPPKKRK